MYIYFENLGFPWRTKFSYRLPYFRKVQTTNELRKNVRYGLGIRRRIVDQSSTQKKKILQDASNSLG
nr:Uncharacterized protein A9P81_0090 [Leptospira interrogans serovar Copenhageni/Icterohaemorrhagiae]